MAKFLRVNPATGIQETVQPISSSSGSGDAAKMIETNGAGKIDETLLPDAALQGAVVVDVLLSETVAAGDLVNVFNDAGTRKGRKASAAATPKRACGVALEGGDNGDTVPVRLGDSVIAKTGHGFTVGIDVPLFLSAGTPGGFTATPPSTTGQLIQRVGYALDANTIRYQDDDFGVLLAQ